MKRMADNQWSNGEYQSYAGQQSDDGADESDAKRQKLETSEDESDDEPQSAVSSPPEAGSSNVYVSFSTFSHRYNILESH